MTLKNFEDYLSEGVVKKHQPNIPRALYLIEEVKKAYLSLNKFVKIIGIDDDSANTSIKLCHDIIHELIRAIMLKRGFSASGNGAHEAEVSYLKELQFKEKDILLVDQLRYSRNSITYYGKVLDKEYAKIVYQFLLKKYSILLNLAEK